MWSIIQQTNPIWHFDASGAFISRVKNQTPPLLYSIVVHDNLHKNILPIGEFFTTAHDANNIGSYLFKIKNILENNKLIMSPVVVVDYSRALINAVLNIFNNCSFDQYLKWAFEFIVLKNVHIFGLIHTKIFLCSVHILKNVIKDYTKVEKRFKFSKRTRYSIKITFIHCFSLLQNSISLPEFNIYLRHIYFIFNSKKLNFLTRESIKSHEKYMQGKKFVQTKDNSSPFKSYFSKKIASFSKAIIHNTKNSKSNLLYNPYYCPSLFKIIFIKLDILPVWTGIMVKESLNTQYVRLDNNPVESYFNNLRNHILGISKKIHSKTRLFPSELLSISFKWLNAKFTEFYENIYREKNGINAKHVGKLAQERWSSKQPKSKMWNKSYYDSTFSVGDFFIYAKL